MLANAGHGGLTVTDLVVATGRQKTGRQKTWRYDRLADLQPAGLVQRARQGRYRLAQQPERLWSAESSSYAA